MQCESGVMRVLIGGVAKDGDQEANSLSAGECSLVASCRRCKKRRRIIAKGCSALRSFIFSFPFIGGE